MLNSQQSINYNRNEQIQIHELTQNIHAACENVTPEYMTFNYQKWHYV